MLEHRSGGDTDRLIPRDALIFARLHEVPGT